MPLYIVNGDPALTQAQTLVIAHNAKGRTEMGAFQTMMLQRYPAAFANYQRKARSGRLKPGTFWLWSEASPRLLFAIVRASSVGVTRLRYAQAVLLTLARDYHRYGIESLALAPLGTPSEQPEIMLLVQTWLGKLPIPIFVYERYQPGIQGEAG